MNDNLVIIDTSIWIDYFRKSDEKIIRLLDELILSTRIITVDLVLGELIQGARTQNEVLILKKYFSFIEILSGNKSTWEKAGELSFSLKKKGKTIHINDCYIATHALDNKFSLFTKDAHFKIIKETFQLVLL
jgi:predicted nucleic acid-binding protein